MTPADRAEAEQELADLQTSLDAVLSTPPLDNDAARRKRAEWVRLTLGEIDRVAQDLVVRAVA